MLHILYAFISSGYLFDSWDLNKLVDQLSRLREDINDAKKRYRSLEDAKSRLEMELAKAKKEV